MSFNFAFDDIFSRLHANYKNGYHLAAKFEGHKGPINTLAFNAAGSVLASGGDDETIHLWDVQTLRALQTLSNRHAPWGQITVLKFIKVNINLTTASGEWLCAGTGRGQFIIYRRTRRSPLFHELSNKWVFSAGDSVESFSFDVNFLRIAVASHYGKIKVYSLDKQTAELTLLWDTELSETIPRAIFLEDRGKLLLVYGMENGHSYDAETSTENSVRYLKTAIGNVDICNTTRQSIIDNMYNGFDLYSPDRTLPLHTFKVESSTRYIRAAAFGESGEIVVAGSDHGRVYIFSTGEKETRQILRHGNRDQMIQVVAIKSTTTEYLIASGSSSAKFGINLWKKARKQSSHEPVGTASDAYTLINVVLVLLFAILVRDAWLPQLKAKYDELSSLVAVNVQRHSAFAHNQPAENQLIEAFKSLDDKTLRRLLGIQDSKEEDG